MQGQPWRAACLGLEQAAGTMRMHQRQSGRHGQGGHHRGPHGRPPDDDNAEDLFSNGSKALCPGHHVCMHGEIERSKMFVRSALILIRRRCPHPPHPTEVLCVDECSVEQHGQPCFVSFVEFAEHL